MCCKDYIVWTTQGSWVNQNCIVYSIVDEPPSDIQKGLFAYFIFCVLVMVQIAQNIGPTRNKTPKDIEILNILFCCVMFILALPPMLYMLYASLQNNTVSEV